MYHHFCYKITQIIVILSNLYLARHFHLFKNISGLTYSGLLSIHLLNTYFMPDTRLDTRYIEVNKMTKFLHTLNL